MNRSIALISASALVLTGIGLVSRHSASSEPEVGVTVVAGFDASESFRPNLNQSVSRFSHFISSRNPASDRLICYRTDSTSVPFFDNRVPDSGERFTRIAATELGSTPARTGTHPSEFYAAIAPTVVAAGRCVVVAIGDGDEDGIDLTTADVQTRHAAATMAANPEAMVFIEATRGNWPRLQKLFSPFGDRLHLCTPGTFSTDDLDRWASDAQQLSRKESIHANR